jgi:hypothetical protein
MIVRETLEADSAVSIQVVPELASSGPAPRPNPATPAAERIRRCRERRHGVSPFAGLR